MRGLIFLTCLVVAALARPDIGYNYNALKSGLPQNAHQLNSHVHQQLPVENNFNNFAAPSTQFLPPTTATASKSSDHLQQLDNSVTPHDGDAKQTSQTYHEDSYNIAFQQSSNSHQSGGYSYKPQTTIHKHIYVHAPPKEFENEEIITTRVHYEAAPKQKHYKIIFIKAPEAPKIRPPVLPPLPQNEEKTLIYVLHKKPELDQDIIIPTPVPTKPSKPEVFFIKYKTQKEEAPVYGPPSQNLDMEPRSIDAPVSEYDVVDDESFTPLSHNESAAPLTTIQPASAQDHPESAQPESQQHVESFNSPSIESEEPQPTADVPNNQYLAPDATAKSMTPIIVEDNHVPSNSYGPPNQFFIKKKK